MAIKKGFTLIELMVVVLIIGILASIVIVNVNNSRINARDAKRVQDLDTINSVLQMYADANNGQYPGLAGTGDARVRSIGASGAWLDWPALASSLTVYIQTLPKDPINNSTYFYGYIGNPSGYKIFATKMESTQGQKKASETNPTIAGRYEIYTSDHSGVTW